MLNKQYEEGNSHISGDYKWLAWDCEDKQYQPSNRRLIDHPVTSWRSMESKLYAMSHIYRMDREFISYKLDLCVTDFDELRKVNGTGRLPGEQGNAAWMGRRIYGSL